MPSHRQLWCYYLSMPKSQWILVSKKHSQAIHVQLLIKQTILLGIQHSNYKFRYYWTHFLCAYHSCSRNDMTKTGTSVQYRCTGVTPSNMRGFPNHCPMPLIWIDSSNPHNRRRQMQGLYSLNGRTYYHKVSKPRDSGLNFSSRSES